MSKLLPRLNGGGGGGCPVLVFGILPNLYVEDVPNADVETLVTEFRVAQKSKWTIFGETLTRYIDKSFLQKVTPTEEDV